MPSLRDLPWLWLGLPEVYVSLPTRRPWQRLDQAAADAFPCRLPADGGGDWTILGVSERLGLPGSQVLARFQGAVLARLLEATARLAAGPAQLFAPPAQCRGLIALAQLMDPRPYGVVLDAVLLARLPAAPTPAPNADAYVLDWRAPGSRIGHGLQPHAWPAGRLPGPALVSAAAYREGRLEPLSYFHGGALLPAQFALEPPTPEAAQGRRPPGLGLVWAWGSGQRLWQWALRPRPLALGPGPLEVRLAPPCTCTLVGAAGAPEQVALDPPIMQWGNPGAGASPG